MPIVTRQESNRKTIIFDGDDTLWETQGLYDAAKKHFGVLLQRVDVEPHLAIETLERIDLANVESLGFSPRRFPNSMRKAVRKLVLDQSTRKELSQRAEEIGLKVFAQRVRPYPSAKKTLKFLKARGWRLVLLTKGDRRVQRTRLLQSGLVDLFHAVEIVGDKTPSVYRALIRKYRLRRNETWVVGNSYRSDIVPALRVGLRAIWIRRNTWRYESAPANLKSIHVRDIRDVPRILEGGK